MTEPDPAADAPVPTTGYGLPLPEHPFPATPAQRLAIAAVAVALVVAALGGAVGWFWAEITPRLQVIKSDRGFLYADAEPEQPIAGDGTFLLLGLGLGILLAILVWVVLRRYRGTGMLAGLTLGSLAGAVIAFWVGHKIGVSQFNSVQAAAPIGAQLSAPVTLRVTDFNPSRSWWPSGVVAAQALAAAFTYTSLAGFSAYEDLGRHRRPAGGPDAPTGDGPTEGAPPPAAPAA